MTKLERRRLRLGLLFISPWIAGFTVFLLGPAVLSFYYSLCDYSVLGPPIPIGAGNYADLATDRIFFKSLWNTLVFGAMALPLTTFCSLALALMVQSASRGRWFFRTVFFLPSVVPLVVLGVLWNWIFNGQFGLLNFCLEMAFSMTGLDELGLTNGPNWLGDPRTAKVALVMTALWGIGQPMVIYLAGLAEIDRAHYEVAIVEGATWLQQSLYITIPRLSPLIYFNVIMGTIGVLQVFAVPYVMMGAQGDPLRSTLFYLMYMFDQAFRKLNMGYASAMAWLLFLVIALLTFAAHKLTIRHVYYDDASA